MRLLNPMHLSLVKLISSLAICLAILIQVGCDGSGGMIVRQNPFLPITPMEYTRTRYSIAKIAIVPIFKDGKLQFITGGTKTDKAYNVSYGAFTPAGEIAWDLTAKFGDQNPRPYSGKSVEMNDRTLSLKTAVNVGDVNGDGFDDLYATNGSGIHVTIISGADGKVIVQSQHTSYPRRKASPDDVVDLDGDGIKDFRFIFKQPSDYICFALSGKDLSMVEETNFQLPDGQKQSKFTQCLADETGDGIKEILLTVGASNLDGVEKNRKFVVVDGKNFEIIRSITESIFDKVQRQIQVQSLGDVNGDGIADFLKYATYGAKSNPDNGFVCAQDGASGEIIWYIDGERAWWTGS